MYRTYWCHFSFTLIYKYIQYNTDFHSCNDKGQQIVLVKYLLRVNLHELYS